MNNIQLFGDFKLEEWVLDCDNMEQAFKEGYQQALKSTDSLAKGKYWEDWQCEKCGSLLSETKDKDIDYVIVKK